MLGDALSELNTLGLNDELHVKQTFVNPKSVTMGQLYGENDRATQEWKDGVLGTKYRILASDQSMDRKWCVPRL